MADAPVAAARVVAHLVGGDGAELDPRQRIDFGDGSTLSAATALGFAWPSWAVFAACLVGRVEQVAGHEPLGLAISCMLRGADTIVASVVELTDDGALACGEPHADDRRRRPRPRLHLHRGAPGGVALARPRGRFTAASRARPRASPAAGAGGGPRGSNGGAVQVEPSISSGLRAMWTLAGKTARRRASSHQRA